MPRRTLRREVTNILERGAAHRTPFFVVRTVPGATSPFVVAVGKRTFPRAVDRNRVRRRLLHAAVRAGSATRGTVLIARARALDAPFSQLVRAMSGAISEHAR